MQESQDESNLPASFTWKDAVFFSAALLFIYSQLFQLPFTPIYFDGDHLIPISNAMRMLDGEVMHRDFFHFAPPGTELIYAALFSIFGVKVWVLNIAIVLLTIAQVWLLWIFSRQVLSGSGVYLPAVIFLTVGFRQMGIDGSYRLFSVVFALAGIAVLMNRRSTRNLILAGGLCGLASFFVQPRGLVGIAGISVFLLWENYQNGFNVKSLLKSGLYLTLPFILVIIVTQSYFAWQAGLGNYYFDLVTFLRKHYPHDPLNNEFSYFSDVPGFGKYLETMSSQAAVFRFIRAGLPVIFYYALIPLTYFVLLFVIWKRKGSSVSPDLKAKLVLLCFAGLALAGGISAPTATRIYHVAIPGIVIFVWLFKQIPFTAKLTPICLFLLVLLGFSYAVQRQAIAKDQIDLPAGNAAFISKDSFGKIEWMNAHTERGDTFYEAFHPSFYFPLHLKNPTPFYLVRDSEYTPYFQVESIVAALEKDPPNLIVWEGTYSKPVGERMPGDNMEPLWQFVSTNYEQIEEFKGAGEFTLTSERDSEVWELKK
ncbi:MAG: glycosyltransferase family 39 protein [Saprospiraceae bacterium]|nr:glycosyltransferase family 39 protein [Pyrinomonadaceae bacterium]